MLHEKLCPAICPAEKTIHKLLKKSCPAICPAEKAIYMPLCPQNPFAYKKYACSSCAVVKTQKANGS
eukprot:scaffold153387_cov24-Tisochrysis_lutea.AAC.1